MRVLACLFLLVACLLPAPAAGGAFSRTPVEDVGIPFWCDWGYDWDERCYRDDTARLPVGGVDDKVWRAALRFSLDGLPMGARIANARLELYFDGACVAPRRRVGPCANPEYAVDAHAVLSPSWTKEREVDFDPVAAASTTVSAAFAHWSAWDLTELVSAWVFGAVPNRGVLLKLAEEEEDFGVGGPYFPSSSFGTASIRPRLVVSYTVPTTGLSP
ncbi:MAG TPA: DNRLRE domain-containing protein [Gaiellaceae bacterium]|nr:DNRLRE domain-containing protein [Gaiellaceae bacterium]